MQHLFAFPRISAVPGFENKVFVPFTNAYHETSRHSTSIVQGAGTDVIPDKVVLASGEVTPYEYLIMATGTLVTTSKAESEEALSEFAASPPQLADGGLIPADVAVACIGAVPLSAPLLSLSPSSVDPKSGYILVKPTWASRSRRCSPSATSLPPAEQGGCARTSPRVSIVNMIAGSKERVEYVPAVPGIHLAIGLHSYVTFYDPPRLGKSRR
ncbi:hypothetical protein DFH09DRAFT_1337920 [Mycena vulgaris]|nr:hypothetical protein DFH09DRAFT_1337920 [Mycena vulgaris]